MERNCRVCIFLTVFLFGLHAVRGHEPVCGEQTYNPRTHMCCGGQIEAMPWNTGSTRSCCGDDAIGTFYNREEKLCCGGHLRDRAPDLGCCNGQHFYDQVTQSCCGMEVISEGEKCCPGPNYGLKGFQSLGEPQSCCGTSGPYLPNTELCCQNGYRSSIRQRLNGVHDQCCGLNRMDSETHMCCDEEQVPREPRMGCCGKGTYNMTTHICCRGNPVLKGPNGGYECCRDRSFNPENEICCHGEVFGIGHGKCCSRGHQSASAYQPLEKSCCDKRVTAIPDVTGVRECCNADAYLTSSQMCCNGTLFDRQADRECCGSSTYDTSTQLCCNGSIQDKVSPSDQCCGSSSFSPLEQTCCSGQIMPKVGACCRLSWNTHEVYNEMQTCCEMMGWRNGTYRVEGHVYNVSSSTNMCCGTSLQAVDQLCDNNELIVKGRPDHNSVCRYQSGGDWMLSTFNKELTYCDRFSGVIAISPGFKKCGYGTYNPEEQVCCDGYVYYISQRSDIDTACCGFRVFDKNWQTCLLGKVFDGIPQEYAGNCRDIAFDNRTDTCDVNSEIRPIAEVEQYPERCGTQPFDPAEHECCNESLIGPDFTCCDGVHVTDTPGTKLREGQCCLDPRDGSSKGYNSHTHICCQGNVYPMNGEDIECCGSDSYNPENSDTICCGHHVYPVSGGKSECTGTTPHRPDQVVCDGVVYPASSTGTCCGKSLINLEDHVCCDGNIYRKQSQDTQCCSKVAYEPSTHSCCGVSLYQTQGADFSCCSNLYYNTNTHVCHESGGKSYLFRLEDENMLCSDGSYDAALHTCCQGILHKFVANGECCGNKVVRHPDREVCCGGEVELKNGRECCGSQMYNVDVSQCCGGRALSRFSVYHQCCNNRIIRAVEECVEN